MSREAVLAMVQALAQPQFASSQQHTQVTPASVTSRVLRAQRTLQGLDTGDNNNNNCELPEVWSASVALWPLLGVPGVYAGRRDTAPLVYFYKQRFFNYAVTPAAPLDRATVLGAMLADMPTNVVVLEALRDGLQCAGLDISAARQLYIDEARRVEALRALQL